MKLADNIILNRKKKTIRIYLDEEGIYNFLEDNRMWIAKPIPVDFSKIKNNTLILTWPDYESKFFIKVYFRRSKSCGTKMKRSKNIVIDEKKKQITVYETAENIQDFMFDRGLRFIVPSVKNILKNRNGATVFFDEIFGVAFLFKLKKDKGSKSCQI